MNQQELYHIDDSIDEGHVYKLVGNQHIRFMKKVDGQLVYEGTTNEELISVLLHRISALNEKFPCSENMHAISALGGALHVLQLRTQRRIAQGVEGQDAQHLSEG